MQDTVVSKNKVEVALHITTKAGVTPKSHTTNQSTIRPKSGVRAYATAVQAVVKEQNNLSNQKKEIHRNPDRLMGIEKHLDGVLGSHLKSPGCQSGNGLPCHREHSRGKP